MNETITKYGKVALTAVVGAGVGVAGYAATDTPTEQTQTYQTLQEQLNTSQAENQELETQVAELQTTVTNQDERVNNLTQAVEQREELVNELQDDLATAQDRTVMVDYLPRFTGDDIEYTGDLAVTVDAEADEGEYDRLNAVYQSENEGHTFDVTVTQYEDSEDADDYEAETREDVSPVSATTNSQTHTVDVTVNNDGSFDTFEVEYDDDVVSEVDEDDITVTVDGNDISEDITTVTTQDDDETLRIELDGTYNLNEGQTVSVSYDDAEATDGLQRVYVNQWYDYEAQDNEFVYRDGNTVVYGQGVEDANGDNFDTQYAEFVSNYE